MAEAMKWARHTERCLLSQMCLCTDVIHLRYALFSIHFNQPVFMNQEIEIKHLEASDLGHAVA
jgi:hypothetical protein